MWEQFGWMLWFLIPLLLALAGLGVWLALRPGKPPVLPAPAAQARQALLALQDRSEDGDLLSQVSHALRRYFINTFWLPPHEMTTSDFCALVTQHEPLGPELGTALGTFLRACDERKFSPAAASVPLNAAQRALELVAEGEVRRLEWRAKILQRDGLRPPTASASRSKARQEAGTLRDTGPNAAPPAP